MSKTIEIASTNKGKVSLCTRRNEQRSIVFEDKNGAFLAMVDEDEAEILLEIGRPTYWKTGTAEMTTEEAVTAAIAADPEAAEAAAAIKTGKSRSKKAA